MCAYVQQEHLLGLDTPLGPDALLLVRMTGEEEMSRLFRFQLEMLSEDDSLPASAIVGKNVTFRVEFPDGEPRYFNGFVTRFAYCGRGDRLSVYRAEVAPWLWFLTKTTDCRIFQNLSVPDIITQVFRDLGFTHFRLDLKGSHPKWEYCVQYRESDFNFVSRLMEEEGISYYFQHDNGKHTLVLGDHKFAFQDAQDRQVEFRAKLTEGNVSDHIWRWEHHYEFRSGKWAHTDYNFESPTTSLMAQTSSVVKLPGNTRFEQYEYPGGHEVRADGDAVVRLRMEMEEAGHDTVIGDSHCRSFSPGGRFKLVGHHSSREAGKGYVLTSVRHSACSEASYWSEAPSEVEPYQNTFVCIPDSVMFRPERRTVKPLIQSVQTAVVTGPPGEEIFTDKYGRVKVQFHWDREGRQDDKTSCWIRVSQSHAGKNWGAIDIPRIGEEVIVSFIDGDPDRPIITGRVYNAGQMPPFGLDGADNATNKVISGMKSKTYKGAGYNEFIMDDTPGNEQIRVHGQYDMDTTIEHDLREKVLNDRTRNVANNETITIGGDRTETVVKNESLTVGVNRTIEVGADNSETIGANNSTTVAANDSTVVGANQSNAVAANRTVQVGSSQSATIGTFRNASVGLIDSVSAGLIENISAGLVVAITAGVTLTLTGPGGTIVIGPGGIHMKGKKIVIEGDTVHINP